MRKKKKDEEAKAIRKTSIGGQALIEGIMMRGPKKIAMAVRNSSNEIVMEEYDYDASARPKIFKIPFLRGMYAFIDSMKFGYKCLMRSAEISGFDEIEEDKKETSEKTPEQTDSSGSGFTEPAGENVSPEPAKPSKRKKKEKKKKEKDEKSSGIPSWVMNVIMAVSSVLGIVFALLLFKLLPEALCQAIPVVKNNQLLRSLFVGVIKIIILVSYMALVTLMKDIKRTFMYHGAEHKSITCYEKGLDLTVENVRKQIRFHPRCGTSFLILMVIVGIVITMFIPSDLHDNRVLNVLFRTLISLALLPVMTGIGYELIKVAGKYDNWLTKIISAPGLWLQRITTKEPDDGMIECAIAALKDVIPDDGSDTWDNK